MVTSYLMNGKVEALLTAVQNLQISLYSNFFEELNQTE